MSEHQHQRRPEVEAVTAIRLPGVAYVELHADTEGRVVSADGKVLVEIERAQAVAVSTPRYVLRVTALPCPAAQEQRRPR